LEGEGLKEEKEKKETFVQSIFHLFLIFLPLVLFYSSACFRPKNTHTN